LWLHSLKVAQLLRSAACLHTNQSRSYLNHLVQSSLLITLSIEKQMNRKFCYASHSEAVFPIIIYVVGYEAVLLRYTLIN